MSMIRLAGNNSEIIIPRDMASDELAKTAGFLDAIGFGGLIPEADFKNLWAKEQGPGGQFSSTIVNLKNAVENGRLDGQMMIRGLEALARAGSAQAAALLPKYKMVLESWMRGNKASQAEAQSIISKLTTEFQKILKTKPPHFMGNSMDRSRSQYV